MLTRMRPQTEPSDWTQMTANWTCLLKLEAHALMGEMLGHPVARRLFEGSIDTVGYTAWLVQAYHAARGAAPLLAQAGQRMKRMGQPPQLAELALQRAVEEQGHQWRLLADLKNLGWAREQVERVGPRPAVAACVAWSRFTSETGSPAAFLGTAYLLEYLWEHLAGVAVERLIAHDAIPHIRRAVTFLRGNAEAGSAHMAELNSLLRPLMDREEQSAILLSARTTRALYTGLFSDGERLDARIAS